MWLPIATISVLSKTNTEIQYSVAMGETDSSECGDVQYHSMMPLNGAKPTLWTPLAAWFGCVDVMSSLLASYECGFFHVETFSSRKINKHNVKCIKLFFESQSNREIMCNYKVSFTLTVPYKSETRYKYKFGQDWRIVLPYWPQPLSQGGGWGKSRRGQTFS